jgi:hypothetical protein
MKQRLVGGLLLCATFLVLCFAAASGAWLLALMVLGAFVWWSDGMPREL